MKFILVALFASLCLVAVNANETDELLNNKEDFQLSDKITGKDIKCVLREIKIFGVAIREFLQNILHCGCKIDEHLQPLVESLKRIEQLCKELDEIYKKDCRNGKLLGPKCLKNLKKKLAELQKEIKHTLTLIAEVQKIPKDAKICIADAIRKLRKSCIELSANVKACINDCHVL